jgi:hypothetical protein
MVKASTEAATGNRRRRTDDGREDSAPYSSKIIKAGALLADTKTLLAHWDLGASAHDNLRRLRRENVFGKASRSRVEDILAVFRQRYLAEEPVTRALVVLVRGRLPAPRSTASCTTTPPGPTASCTTSSPRSWPRSGRGASPTSTCRRSGGP